MPGVLTLAAPGFSTGLRLLDAGLVAASLWACSWLRPGGWTDPLPWLALCSAALFVLLAEIRGAYRSWRTGGLAQEAGELLVAWLGVLFALLVFHFATQSGHSLSQRTFLAWAFGVPVWIVASRIALRGLARRVRARGGNTRRVAIAGVGTLARRVAATLRDEPWMGLQLVGFFDDRRRMRPAISKEAAPLIAGSLDDLVAASHRGEHDVVYIALPLRAERRIKTLVRRLAEARVAVHLVPDVTDLILLRSRWLTLGNTPVVSLVDAPLDGMERAVKRAEDLVLAVGALACASLPMLLIAAAVKLTSKGPVIFRQRRYGLDGSEITVFKFRTMSVLEDGPDVQQARRNDPRVTKLGRILRATSLDELPQLFNILRGDMSMVGPRPHPTVLDDQHRDLIDLYFLRHRMKPGLTGWAQVNGFRGETDSLDKMTGRIDHDLHYIRQWSLPLDLKIVALTVVRGFSGKNAH